MNDSRRSERPAAQLRRLWRENRAPDLDDYLAKAGSLDSAELAAVLRVDQAERWSAGNPLPTEDYLQRYPAVAADAEAAVDLIHNEFLIAERAGRPFDPEVFVGRFPAHIDTLRLQIELHRAILPATDGINSTLSLPPAEANGTLSTAAVAASVPMGERFGEFELIETIARGGMGVVYKARQPKLDRIVALKMILAGHLASAGAVERFRTEAQSAAHLDHPGIVPVFEIGEHQGQHYFTMAYVEGRSLAELLRDGPLPAPKAARIVRELCAAIAYAHDHGIVHRDLKPANVILDGQGHSKLTDFGLAKRTYDSNEMTGTGEILGTPAYMSPEQAAGGGSEIGPLADVYGLGALLFALTTGRPPLQAATPIETIQHVISVDPPRLRSLNPSVPRDLETICLKCLEKSPAKRYPSATEIAADLDRFLTGLPILARPVGTIEKAYRWYCRRPVMGSMAVALILLLAAVPILLLSLWSEAEARANAAAAGRVKEKQARIKIEEAEVEKTRELFAAYVKEAASRRSSPKVGRRFEAIDRIVAARDIADELNLPASKYTQLRSEAISALSLVDLRATTTDSGWAGTTSHFSLCYVNKKDLYLDWDPPDGLLVRREADHRIVHRLLVEHAKEAENDARISPDNRFVFSVDGKTLVVWQVDGAMPKEVLRRTGVAKAWFAPDRQEIVVFQYSWELLVLPLPDGAGKMIRTGEFLKTQVRLRPSALGPNGQLAICRAKSVFVIDLNLGKETFSIPVSDFPDSIAWVPDGETLAISSRDIGIILYRPRDKSQQLVKAPLGGPAHVGFDPSGRFALLVNQWTGRNVVFDIALGLPELRFHSSELEKHSSPSAIRWGITLDNIHRVIPLRSEDGLAVFESTAVHPNGRLLATPTAKGIVFTDLATGVRLGMLLAPGECSGARFDSTGNLFAVREDGRHDTRVCRWEVRVAGNRLTVGAPTLMGESGVASIDVSADGRYVAAAEFDSTLIHDRQTGQSRVVEQKPDLRRVAIHRDGSLVASFSFGPPGFRVGDAKTEKILLSHPTGTEGRGRFTPDGKHLITYGHGEAGLLVWSVPECKLIRKLGSIGVFAISHDSKYVAVTEPAGKIRLDRIADGEMIARFDAPGQDYLIDLAFSPDGRRLLGMNAERTRHHVWDLWKLRRQLRELKLDWEPDPPPDVEEDAEPITLLITPQTWWGPLIGPVSPRSK